MCVKPIIIIENIVTCQDSEEKSNELNDNSFAEKIYYKKRKKKGNEVMDIRHTL